MKVKSVRRVTLSEAVPVYDLSVPALENFKLADGPFVHNSKDVSDAVAGAVYTASQARVIRSQTTVSGVVRDRVRSKKVSRRSFRKTKTID